MHTCSPAIVYAHMEYTCTHAHNWRVVTDRVHLQYEQWLKLSKHMSQYTPICNHKVSTQTLSCPTIFFRIWEIIALSQKNIIRTRARDNASPFHAQGLDSTLASTDLLQAEFIGCRYAQTLTCSDAHERMVWNITERFPASHTTNDYMQMI